MSRGPDVGTRLARAIVAGAPGVVVTGRGAVPWASVTFAGARHTVMLEAPATPAVERWLADLPEAEFSLPGHLVADIAIVAMSATAERLSVTIEALTVET
jgi:hypothetical protein